MEHGQFARRDPWHRARARLSSPGPPSRGTAGHLRRLERRARQPLRAQDLRPDRAVEPRARRSLETEGRLLRQFAHPHLVRAYEVTHSRDGRPVVVLETLAGETLSHIVDRLGNAGHRLPIARWPSWASALLGDRLSPRHDLLHLDVKPDNIVAENGRAHLIDLSLARRPGGRAAGPGRSSTWLPSSARR